MRQPDCETSREWIQLDSDGELAPVQAAALGRHLGSCSECARESAGQAELAGLLAASRVEPGRELRERVMASLPAAGWEARHPRSWVAAVAVTLLLAAGAAVLAGVGGGLRSATPFLAALGAVADLFRSSALAGAGMLGASWRGLGLALEELLGGSVWNLVAFGALVLGLDLLLLRSLLRRPARSATEVERREPGAG